MKVNFAALTSWAVATGRLSHTAEVLAVDAGWREDPVRTLGRLLLMEPTRPDAAPCPLFAKDRAKSAQARETWRRRKAEQAATADTVSQAISSVLQELGHDPADPALRALVLAEMRSAEAAAKKAARTAARAAAAEKRKLEEHPFAALIKAWSD